MSKKSIIYIILSFMLLSCSKKSSKTHYTDNLDFNYFSSKAKINFDDGANNYNINANIRIKHDSIIWVSSYSSLFKIGKCLITKDSIFILKDIQANEYYQYSFSELATKIGYDINFEILESILMGNTPNLNGKIKATTQGTSTVITEKINELTIESEINTAGRKLTKLNVTQNNSTNSINMEYDGFEEINGKTFATTNNINTNLQLKPEEYLKAIIQMKYVKPKFTDEKLSFPFVVSSRYEHKN